MPSWTMESPSIESSGSSRRRATTCDSCPDVRVQQPHGVLAHGSIGRAQDLAGHGVTEARVSTSAMSSAARFRTMACGAASCAAWPRREARCTRESGTVGVSTGNGRPANLRSDPRGLRSTPTTLASATPMSTSTSLTRVRRGGSAVITGLSRTSRPTQQLAVGPRPDSTRRAPAAHRSANRAWPGGASPTATGPPSAARARSRITSAVTGTGSSAEARSATRSWTVPSRWPAAVVDRGAEHEGDTSWRPGVSHRPRRSGDQTHRAHAR